MQGSVKILFKSVFNMSIAILKNQRNIIYVYKYLYTHTHTHMYIKLADFTALTEFLPVINA